MIPIPEEMKICPYCAPTATQCRACYNHSKFILTKKIEAYAKANFEAGIKYANEAQIKEKGK